MMGRRHFLTAALAARACLCCSTLPAAAQAAEQLRANAQACELRTRLHAGH